MLGFSSFTFGFQNYCTFTFSFQIGRQASNPPTGTSEPTAETITEPAREVTTKPTQKSATKLAGEGRQVATKSTIAATVKPTEAPALPKLSVILQKHCPLLDTIPLEIRCMIYEHLLVLVDPIDSEQANKLLGENKTILLNQCHPISHIGATLLRTCRTIYQEALPVLYGRNVFDLSSPKAIRDFRDSGINIYTQGRDPSTTHVFDLKRYQPQGRLTLIRSIRLKFAPDPSSTIFLFDRTTEPKEALIVWTKDFFNSLFYDFRFPALQSLTLDFLEMRLDENEGLRVDPFVRRLAPAEGLQKLVIKGLKHEKTLKELRAGLCKGKESFVVDNPSI